MKFKVHYKITLIFVLIVALIFFGTFLYLNNNLRNHTLKRIRQTLTSQTSFAQTFLEANLPVSLNIAHWDQLADQIGSNLNLRATIIDSQGKVLGDSELSALQIKEVENHLYRQEVQQALQNDWGESRRFSTTIKKDMLYIAKKFDKEKMQGVARLAIPLSEIELISNQLKNFLAASFMVAFCLAILLSYLVSIYISRPIEEVSQFAKGVAGGDFSKKIIVSSKDEIGDLAVAFNNMSEQIRARIDESSIGKSRLEAVLLSMFEGVLVIDKDETILLMNQTLKNLLHINENPIGKRPLEVIRNADIQEVITDIKKLHHKEVLSREIMLLLPEERILLIHATSVTRHEQVEGIVLIFHDITELRRYEKLRQEFVANVSHELRTPIASIKGYAETLIDGAIKDKENSLDFLNIIHTDADRLARLIEDILDLSKIESGMLKLNIKPCALKPIVDRVVAGLSKQLKEKKIKLEINIPVDAPYVMVDEDRLAQVLLNLIDNAIKYTPKKGQITISIEEDDLNLKVLIQDTGIGIPAEDLPRLFERFYRVDKARSRELGGTGLGLSIVKHIIQSLNGEVFVHSQPDQGSVFSFTLPKA